MSENYSSNNANYFNSRVCKLLIEYLSHVQLDGINSIDQIHLVAIADTAANIKCDVAFTNQNDIFRKKKFTHQQKSTECAEDDILGSLEDEKNFSQTVDTCGFKFLLALRSYNYLMRTLPISDRDKLKKSGLGTSVFTWAFHSECEQELLGTITNCGGLTQTQDTGSSKILTWTDLRQYGVGWWLKSPTLLKQLIERVAKCTFQLNNDPLDAAIFYLAMKKKALLVALFKTVKDTRMTDFFKNDFTQSKWQSAALKNAFVLLGKQRFEHAAAFFLLAGRLKDAVEVCCRNLKDLQLAMILIRLFEADIEQATLYINTILSVEILGMAVETAQSNIFGQVTNLPGKQKCSSDPFLRSMSYWFIKDYKQALNTLYEIDFANIFEKSTQHNVSEAPDAAVDTSISQVFNFYTFLKNHPLVLRHLLIEGNNSQDKSQFVEPKSLFSSNNLTENSNVTLKSISSSEQLVVTPIERRLHFIVAYSHLINGCPLLTLEVLSKLPNYISDESNKKSDPLPPNKTIDEPDFKKPLEVPAVLQRAELFDWSSGGFMSKRIDDEELELDLKFSSDSEDLDDEDNNVFSDKKESVHEKTLVEEAQPTEQDQDNLNRTVDMFAQQIKFLSCLKILIQEMSTLATGFEVIGGQLR